VRVVMQWRWSTSCWDATFWVYCNEMEVDSSLCS
jgi:hypothetical protein